MWVGMYSRVGSSERRVQSAECRVQSAERTVQGAVLLVVGGWVGDFASTEIYLLV